MYTVRYVNLTSGNHGIYCREYAYEAIAVEADLRSKGTSEELVVSMINHDSDYEREILYPPKRFS